MGRQLYATNQPQADLPIDEAVRLSRAAPRIERHFHLFKDAPVGICPMYVRNDDQIKGLCRLLSLCVRLMTLMEIVTRRRLAEDGQTLAGLYPGQPTRTTDRPTAVKLLRAFRGIYRLREGAENHERYTTPLIPLQRQILDMLDIDDVVYYRPTEKRSTLNAIGQLCGQVLANLSHAFDRVVNRS